MNIPIKPAVAAAWHHAIGAWHWTLYRDYILHLRVENQRLSITLINIDYGRRPAKITIRKACPQFILLDMDEGEGEQFSLRLYPADAEGKLPLEITDTDTFYKKSPRPTWKGLAPNRFTILNNSDDARFNDSFAEWLTGTWRSYSSDYQIVSIKRLSEDTIRMAYTSDITAKGQAQFGFCTSIGNLGISTILHKSTWLDPRHIADFIFDEQRQLIMLQHSFMRYATQA